MASSDKTREKLLSSMRKTKDGSGKKEASATTEPAKKETAKPAAANKPAKSAQKKPAPAAKAKASSASSDPFQSSRRVWPD